MLQNVRPNDITNSLTFMCLRSSHNGNQNLKWLITCIVEVDTRQIVCISNLAFDMRMVEAESLSWQLLECFLWSKVHIYVIRLCLF